MPFNQQGCIGAARCIHMSRPRLLPSTARLAPHTDRVPSNLIISHCPWLPTLLPPVRSDDGEARVGDILGVRHPLPRAASAVRAIRADAAVAYEETRLPVAGGGLAARGVHGLVPTFHPEDPLGAAPALLVDRLAAADVRGRGVPAIAASSSGAGMVSPYMSM